jgi:NDP-sugar pyrophosphorylase family protein
MVDIHEDKKVYLNRPELFLPERKSSRGRKPTRLKATEEDISVSEYIKTLQYSDIFNYHKNIQNEITLVAALKQYHIPFGTLETTLDGILTALTEKPELNFKINSGMHIIEPDVLNEIPDNTFLHITNLIEDIMQSGGIVGVFPVSENSWKDMGSLKSYNFNK